MSKKKIKVVLGIPMIDRIPADFFQSVLTLDLRGLDVKVAVEAGSLVYTARNSIVAYAADAKADYIMWMDSDMIFPRDTVQTLLKDALDNDLDYVSGIYFKRAFPTAPVIVKDLIWARKEDGTYDNGAELYKDYPKDQLFEIAASGFGCVLTRVDTLLSVTAMYKMSPFEPLPCLGEDYSFCKRFANVGGKMWCDSRVKCGHVGKYVYTEKDWERQNADTGKPV